MKKKYIFSILFIILTSLTYGQNAVLCPSINDYISIEDVINVPTVNDNGDGTITLVHSEQYITDIFANHIIYGFLQSFPNSSPTLEKYYTISYDNKDLINELKASVPDDVFLIESEYEYSAISSELIDYLDDKIFRMTGYCSIADNSGEECPEQPIPDDVNISVTFNYDSDTDMMLMESIGLTECGNSFSIGLRGGTEPDTLQLWYSMPSVITETDYQNDACHSIEEHLYSMLDIACQGINIGDLFPTFDVNDNTLVLFRENMIFGYHTASFVSENLSVAEFPLEKIRLYQLEGNPYLQISNSQNVFEIEIFSVSGSQILEQTRFEQNQISIDEFSNGIYFIKLTDSNSSKTFKFLKR